MNKKEEKESKAPIKATKKYHFPSVGKTIEAENYEEALTKLNKK